MSVNQIRTFVYKAQGYRTEVEETAGTSEQHIYYITQPRTTETMQKQSPNSQLLMRNLALGTL